jgi:putative DNA methylase
MVPLSLKDAPSLIEKILPAQKLSIEAFKEQMAVHGKTLTALGSYWKGRKPLILNKACILGALLPATSNLRRDLEIFEMLMGMDDESFLIRWGSPRPEFILKTVAMPNLYDYFEVEGGPVLPGVTPLDLDEYAAEDGSKPKVSWRKDVSVEDFKRLRLEALARIPYRERVELSKRPEQVYEEVHAHIWDAVNEHYGTNARSFPEFTAQMGLLRFGRRPRVMDTFSGSGQIPFEAARLGCDTFASDLNPISCMLTWGSLNIVGASEEERSAFERDQKNLARRFLEEMNALDVESDGKGWNAKVFLYCAEALCPESGWRVPLLPSFVVSKSGGVVVELVPDAALKRYAIKVKYGATPAEVAKAETGTVTRSGKYAEAYLEHRVGGRLYRTKITSLRGDATNADGVVVNKLRQWSRSDFMPRQDDIIQERLYCIQWTRKKPSGKGDEYQFRSVTDDDLARERKVENFVEAHLQEWQDKGYIPDMRIEVGGPPRYQGLDLVRARGWTHWHHAFNPRQLLTAGLINKLSDARFKFALTQVLNNNCKLSRWLPDGNGQVKGAFDNQALNTLYNYGCRSATFAADLLTMSYKNFDASQSEKRVINAPANAVAESIDIFVTDPPYGDAVKYEEILDFFIGWLRKNKPPEFADWVWDSRRALAIKGEDDDFRRSMISAYSRMAAQMPDNGVQVVMFTHQSGSIWADMANIIWASGLQVTAAWYVVTETDSALREGSYVKGTILLVLRKRAGSLRTYQSDLAWELEQEVNDQVATLTGLNQQTRSLNRDENVFSDADLQMAGYAAALRVLTRYSVIDGRDMAAEAQRPRVKGQKTLVDDLIEFAVGVANQALVPDGLDKPHWDKLQPAERFYLKMLDLESYGVKSLDNYQNFAKAFKVKDFRPLMASEKANAARLKSAAEFGRAEMNETSELYNSPLRGILYGIMELGKDRDGDEVVAHMAHNIPDFYNQREVVIELTDYLSKRLEPVRPDEASSARVLRDLVRNQRL